MGSEEKEMSFLDHLEELRWHVIRAGAPIPVFALIAFLSKDFVWGTLILGPSQTDFFPYRALCVLGGLINSDVLCIMVLRFILQSRQMTGQYMLLISSSLGLA